MIVIDCFSLILKEGGTKAYLRSLLHAISVEYKTPITILVPDFPELNDSDIPQTSTFHIHKKKLNPLLLSFIKTLTGAAFYRYIAYIWEAYYLPHEIKALNPEIVFHPYQLVTDYPTTAKKIVVIHDIFHWKYQERYSAVEKWIYNSFLRGCRTADEIITISQTSKNEIVAFTKITPEKIHVCYEGFNKGFSKTAISTTSTKEIVNHYLLPQQYILAFNSSRTHKNTIAAVKVFADIKKKLPNMHLVLVGGTSHTNESVLSYLSDQNLLSSTHFISVVETIEHFTHIYNLSVAFLFLSTEEGFGLPPLEALASGTLPIISNLSSLKELFAPVLPSFNPDDTTDISRYIQSLISQPEVKLSAIRKAEVLLQKFSWPAILPLYADILSLD